MTMRERLEAVGWRILVALIISILILPIIIVVLTSFTTQSAPTIPEGEWTLEWYETLANNQELIDAIRISFSVGIASALLSGLVGTATAIGFVRADIPFRETFATLMLMPLLISPVITGVALLRYTGELGIDRGYPTLVVAHATLAFPFVFLLVRASLLTFDTRLEDASRTLGANSLETVLNVTIPNIAPAIVSATILAFIVSFGEFTASQFLVTPGETTVPVIIYNQIQTGLTPEVSALSTVLFLALIVFGIVSSLVSGGVR
jgi:spermidine/putrescine transport system permease protein